MKIGTNKHVSVTYTLFSEKFDGEIQEQTTEENPLSFIFGAGMMLPKFEEHLEGLSEGDDYKIEIKSADAYGDVIPEMIADLPISIFKPEGEDVEEGILEVGNILPMMDGSGNRLAGKIVEIAEETVKMDFNHPMASKDLFFVGKVVGVREASEEEINELNAAANPNGEGCGCSDGEKEGCGSGGCC